MPNYLEIGYDITELCVCGNHSGNGAIGQRLLVSHLKIDQQHVCPNVGRNLWICGSRCAICGSLPCAGIHGSRMVVAGAIYGFWDDTNNPIAVQLTSSLPQSNVPGVFNQARNLGGPVAPVYQNFWRTTRYFYVVVDTNIKHISGVDLKVVPTPWRCFFLILVLLISIFQHTTSLD